MFQDSPLPPTCLDLPHHSLSTGDSCEAPVDTAATGNPDVQAIGSWASLGKSAATEEILLGKSKQI